MGSQKNNAGGIVLLLSIIMLGCYATRHNTTKQEAQQSHNILCDYTTDTLIYGKDCIDFLLFLRENIKQESNYNLCFKDFSLDSLLHPKRFDNKNIFSKSDTTVFKKYLNTKIFHHRFNNVNYFQSQNYANDTTVLYLNCTDTLHKYGQEVVYFVFSNNTGLCITYTKNDPWPTKL